MSLTLCKDEYDTGRPGSNPFCHLPEGHDGDHEGLDAFFVLWDWSYGSPAS